jgi:hypothetical protein
MLFNTSLSGKKKMWRVDVDKNKIVVQHGFVDGKITTNETICMGKKNTTPEEQAQSKTEVDKLNSDIETLVKEIPEFDTIDSAKSKINEFIS